MMGRCNTTYGKFHADLVLYSVTPERYCQLYNHDHFFKLTPESGTLLDGSQRTLESLGGSLNGNIDTFGWNDSVPPFAGTAVFFSLSDLVLFFSVHSLMTILMVEQSISTLSSCLVLLTITPKPLLGLQRHRRPCVICLLTLDVEKMAISTRERFDALASKLILYLQLSFCIRGFCVTQKPVFESEITV